MKNFTVKDLIINALVGALYVALIFLFAELSFGEIQFRIAEVLLIFLFINRKLSLGIILGTFISNLLLSPIALDMIFGTFATILSIMGLLLFIKRPAIALLFPVLVNGIIIGISLKIQFDTPLIASMIYVSIGQAAVLYLIGLPLYHYLKKRDDLVELLK